MNEIKRVLLFPGAFNPPTFGHMRLLLQAIETIRPDVSLVLPVYESLCLKYEETDLWHRRSMIRAAIDNALPLPISEMADTDSHKELKGGRPERTHELVEHYQRTYPGAEMWLLLGRHGAESAQGWLKVREMVKAVSVAVSRDAERNDIELLRDRKFDVRVLPKKPSSITPEYVRNLLRSGKSTWRYLPVPVLRIIEEHGLYGCKKGRPAWALK